MILKEPVWRRGWVLKIANFEGSGYLGEVIFFPHRNHFQASAEWVLQFLDHEWVSQWSRRCSTAIPRKTQGCEGEERCRFLSQRKALKRLLTKVNEYYVILISSKIHIPFTKILYLYLTQGNHRLKSALVGDMLFLEGIFTLNNGSVSGIWRPKKTPDFQSEHMGFNVSSLMIQLQVSIFFAPRNQGNFGAEKRYPSTRTSSSTPGTSHV